MVIPLLSRGDASDKRITAILKTYWDFLREDRAFPELREVHPEAVAEIWDSCFIVMADNNSRPEDYVYSYLGKKIIDAYGKDLTGFTIDSMVSTQAGHLAQKYEKVLAIKRPVIDDGQIKLPYKKQMKYRQVLLPLGEKGITINAIIGGMSYKVFG